MTHSASAMRHEAIAGFHWAPSMALAFPLCAVAWGALAFGGAYPWAYWPLAAACTVAGSFGFFAGRAARITLADWSMRIALTSLAAAILVQLIPLPAATLSTLSPGTIDVVRQLDVSFGGGLVPSHSISVWPKDTIVALALYGSLALLLVGTARLLSVTGSRTLVEALTAFGVVLAFVGIIQKPLYAGAIYGVWTLEIGRTPFGPFVNRNHFAGWMLMVLPLALALISARIDRSMRGLRPGWRHKVLWFSSPEASQLILIAAAAVVMALSLMMTMSRSGILAFILSLLVMGWFIIQALESRARRMAATVCLVVLAALVVVWAGPDALASRFGSGDWGELNNRRGAWTDAWAVIRAFPLAGTGLNTYWAAALFYQRHELTHFFAQAHNDYLQLAAEGGLLLTLPALVCVVVFVRDVRRAMQEQRGSMTWWLRVGAVTSLMAIACQESVEFSLQMPGNAALFVVVCAIALHRPPFVGRGADDVPRRPRLVSEWPPRSLNRDPAFPRV